MTPNRDALLFGALCTAWVIVLAFFHIFPAADLGFSSIFCGGGKGGAEFACAGFPAKNDWLAIFFRKLFYWTPVAALAALLLDLVWTYLADGWANRQATIGKVLAISAYFLGPGLIVNGLMKSFSGRPRPHETFDFGGSLDFVAAGDFTGACTANCSFVSGEAAAAGWLICLLPLLSGRFRYFIAALLIDVSIATPLLRVAMGGHYLSDAILGWLIGAASFAFLALGLMLAPALVAKASPSRKSATLERAR